MTGGFNFTGIDSGRAASLLSMKDGLTEAMSLGRRRERQRLMVGWC
jgi:hypothetical protein